MDYVVIPQLKAYEKQRTAKCSGIEFEYKKKNTACAGELKIQLRAFSRNDKLRYIHCGFLTKNFEK